MNFSKLAILAVLATACGTADKADNAKKELLGDNPQTQEPTPQPTENTEEHIETKSKESKPQAQVVAVANVANPANNQIAVEEPVASPTANPANTPTPTPTPTATPTPFVPPNFPTSNITSAPSQYYITNPCAASLDWHWALNKYEYFGVTDDTSQYADSTIKWILLRSNTVYQASDLTLTQSQHSGWTVIQVEIHYNNTTASYCWKQD